MAYNDRPFGPARSGQVPFGTSGRQWSPGVPSKTVRTRLPGTVRVGSTRGTRGGGGSFDGHGLFDFARRLLEPKKRMGGALEKIEPTRDPMDDILAAMQSLLGQTGAESFSPTQVDLGDLRGQIEAEINPVYDARRKAIENLMARAEQRTATNRADVTGMYNALAGDYDSQALLADQQADQAAQEAQALQGQLKSNIHGNYSKIQDEQLEMLSQLGLEATAASDSMLAQGQDQAFMEGIVDQTGAANQSFLQNQGTIDQQYYTQGAPLAKLEGANRSTDLLAMLESYLADQSNELNMLEGERTSDITGAFRELSTAAQQAAGEADAARYESMQQQNQMSWERLMDLAGIQTGRSDREFDQWYKMQQLAGQGSASRTGVPAFDVASQLGLSESESVALANAWAEIQNNPMLQFGQQANTQGEMVDLTQAAIDNLVRQYAIQNRLDPRLTNALLSLANQTRE